MAIDLPTSVTDMIGLAVEEERKRVLASLGGITAEQLETIAGKIKGFAVPAVFKEDTEDKITAAVDSALYDLAQLGTGFCDDKEWSSGFHWEFDDETCKRIGTNAFIQAAREVLDVKLVDTKSCRSSPFKFIGFQTKAAADAAELRNKLAAMEEKAKELQSKLDGVDFEIEWKRDEIESAMSRLKKAEDEADARKESLRREIERVKGVIKQIAINESKAKAEKRAACDADWNDLQRRADARRAAKRTSDQPVEPPAKRQAQ